MTDTCRFDTDKIDEIALGLLSFTMHEDGPITRAWKNIGWDILDRLHEKGWIGDPKTKAKSVVLTEEGERLAREYARKHFSVPE